jgi:hypothetical protein
VLVDIDETASRRSGRARQTTTLGDGSFVLEGLGRQLYSLWVIHPDHAELELRRIKGGTLDLRLRVPRPARLEVVVVGKNGRPVKEYAAVAIPVAPSGPESPQERTRREGSWENPRLDVKDPRGAFRVPKIAPGRYDVTVATPDGRLGQALDVALAEGTTRSLRLVAEPGGVVVGRVVDGTTGAPLPGARVGTLLPGFREQQTEAGGDGTFRLAGVPAGQREIYLGAGQSHAPQRVKVNAGKEVIDLGTVRLAPAP